MESEMAQQSLGRDTNCDTIFCLSHPDFRADNIIVDDNLHLCGIIDWEFSELVPLSVFVPPMWITGHDPVSAGRKTSLLSEFLSVMSSSQRQSSAHFLLALAHILRDPAETQYLFYDFIYTKHYSTPCDEFIAAFFQQPENSNLRQFVQQRVLVSGQYTEYLKHNGLFDEEAQEWQKLRDLMAESQKLLEKSRESDAEIQELLANADKLLQSLKPTSAS
ncbi:hypothetical protein IL306_002366 [Fusarium sp. DS 682]|nr:hypothetical protein IL306_002366 [Fusarium sp. DS 682]